MYCTKKAAGGTVVLYTAGSRRYICIVLYTAGSRRYSCTVMYTAVSRRYSGVPGSLSMLTDSIVSFLALPFKVLRGDT